MKLVRNLQYIGNLANMVFWIPEICADDDVVVVIDGDDAILGAQSLKIVNAAYHSNKELMYIYAQYIQKWPGLDFQKGHFYKGLSQDTSVMRRRLLYEVPVLRTFKVKLFKAVPLYQFLEYHYDNETGLGWPFFVYYTADYIQIWTQFELAGNDRTKHLNDSYLYYYLGPSITTRKCYQIKEQFDAYKNNVRTPLKKLNCMSDTPEQI